MRTDTTHRRRGQSIAEYLVVTAAILGVLAAITQAIGQEAQTAMTNAVNHVPLP